MAELFGKTTIDELFGISMDVIDGFHEAVNDMADEEATQVALARMNSELRHGRSYTQIALFDLTNAIARLTAAAKKADPQAVDVMAFELYSRVMVLQGRQDTPEASRKIFDRHVARLAENGDTISIPRFLSLVRDQAKSDEFQSLSQQWAWLLRQLSLSFQTPESAAPLVEAINMGVKLAETIGEWNPQLSNSLMVDVNQRVARRAGEDMQKDQRIYMLHKQMKAIKDELKELGDEDSSDSPWAHIKKKLDEKSKTMPEDVRARAEKGSERLMQMPPSAAEATVASTYLDHLVSMPWGKVTEINKDPDAVRKALDDKNYAMEKPKQRVVEAVVVANRTGNQNIKPLLFVGPPGVGKTSLAIGIAEGTGRVLKRVPLGGVRDEAEIRGHRTTYIGAKPGRIVAAIEEAGTDNLVLLLDEVDKMGEGNQGDPEAALLEFLDPNQNTFFRDHYLDVPYDVSKVMVICTANRLDTLKPATLDRFEVISVHGYTHEEKMHIARNYLLPKKMTANGLTEEHVEFTDAALNLAISKYTREAGVRQLEGELDSLCRKAAVADEDKKKNKSAATKLVIDVPQTESFLGAPTHHGETAPENDEVGLVNALFYSDAGGGILPIEGELLESTSGKFEVEATGHLGPDMQESVKNARTVFEKKAQNGEIKLLKPLEKMKIHINGLGAAIPKDGPSAGVSILTVMTSVATGVPVHRNIAMTGEISVRGKVLPIGGLDQKFDGALQGGADTVMYPARNEPDLQEVPPGIRAKLQQRPVTEAAQALDIALGPSWRKAANDEAPAAIPPAAAVDVAQPRPGG